MNDLTLVHVPLPGADATVAAARVGDQINIAIKPACEAIGIDYSGQVQRLKRQPWATVGVTPTVAEDGKARDMLTVDRRTFTMWLATLDAGRLKNDHARETLATFQREAADALDRYFHVGVAVNAAKADDEIVRQALAIVHRDLEAANTRIAALEPRASYVDAFVADDDLRLLRNVAKSLGLQEKQLRDALIKHEWIYPEKSSRWSEKRQQVVPQVRYSAYASHRDHFRPVPAHDAPRFKGEVDHILKVTPVGALAIERAARRWGLLPADDAVAAA